MEFVQFPPQGDPRVDGRCLQTAVHVRAALARGGLAASCTPGVWAASLHSSSCEQALSQVKAGGYALLALHLQGSVEHTAALGANGTAARRRRSLVHSRALSGSLGHIALVLVGGSAPSAAAPTSAGPPPLRGVPLAVVVGAEYEGVGEAAARLADERVGHR